MKSKFLICQNKDINTILYYDYITQAIQFTYIQFKKQTSNSWSVKKSLFNLIT